MQWRKWPEISERHEKNRPAFTERFVFFRNDPFSPSRPAPDNNEREISNYIRQVTNDKRKVATNIMSFSVSFLFNSLSVQ